MVIPHYTQHTQSAGQAGAGSDQTPPRTPQRSVRSLGAASFIPAVSRAVAFSL